MPTSSSASLTPSGSATTASTISGSGYQYEVPDGWGRPDQDIPGFDFDSFALDLQDKDSFADNINVILSPAGELTPDQVEKAAKSELEAGHLRNISVENRVTVAGSESAHVTATGSVNEIDYTIEQFYPTNNGQTFVVTISFSTSLTAKQRAKTTGSILASWTWSN